MPCNSEYMEATGFEVEMSRVAALLDELNGYPIEKSDWNGYHSRVYSVDLSKADADQMVETLCSILQKIDVSQQSLEMQMWWRDHQKADKDRLEAEIKTESDEEKKQEALKKLTPYERELLGV